MAVFSAFLMEAVYSNGEIIDYSDEGLAVRNIEADIDYQILLKQLSNRQLEVLALKLDGFSNPEIAVKLKVSRITIWREMKQIKKFVL